jgi:hypothetical protein
MGSSKEDGKLQAVWWLAAETSSELSHAFPAKNMSSARVKAKAKVVRFVLCLSHSTLPATP